MKYVINFALSYIFPTCINPYFHLVLHTFTDGVLTNPLLIDLATDYFVRNIKTSQSVHLRIEFISQANAHVPLALIQDTEYKLMNTQTGAKPSALSNLK